MNFEEVKFDNPGILKFKLPENIFLPLRKNLESVIFENTVTYNKQLVGQLQHEIKYDCPAALKLFLLQAAKLFCNHNNYYKNKELLLSSIWANFQKKFEYNPAHMHKGIISFILFVKIPYNLFDEDKLDNTKFAASHYNGRLHFFYQTLFNNMSDHTFNIDSSYEGMLLMFPNTAHHSVYPFYTSDNYRISISGNFETVRD